MHVTYIGAALAVPPHTFWTMPWEETAKLVPCLSFSAAPSLSSPFPASCCWGLWALLTPGVSQVQQRQRRGQWEGRGWAAAEYGEEGQGCWEGGSLPGQGLKTKSLDAASAAWSACPGGEARGLPATHAVLVTAPTKSWICLCTYANIFML